MRARKVALDAFNATRLVGALNTMYSYLGYEFIHSNDMGGGEDETWADAFKRFGGKIVLSGDISIGRRPHQHAAFIENKFICFFPVHPFQNLKIHQQLAYFVHNWKLIDDNIDKYKPGTCWKMPVHARGNSLTLSDAEFEQMIVPKEVLNEIKNKRTA